MTCESRPAAAHACDAIGTVTSIETRVVPLLVSTEGHWKLQVAGNPTRHFVNELNEMRGKVFCSQKTKMQNTHRVMHHLPDLVYIPRKFSNLLTDGGGGNQSINQLS